MKKARDGRVSEPRKPIIIDPDADEVINSIRTCRGTGRTPLTFTSRRLLGMSTAEKDQIAARSLKGVAIVEQGEANGQPRALPPKPVLIGHNLQGVRVPGLPKISARETALGRGVAESGCIHSF